MNAVRLMLGTLTVVRVRPPTHVNTDVAGKAMMLAPSGGAVLALLVALPLGLLLSIDELWVSPVAWAVLAIGALAWLTRGMHLDGLADTADGLGSGRGDAGALEVMKKSDIGPFGVITLTLVLILQVFLLAQLIDSGLGPLILALALVASRWVLPILCTPVFPAARADGLGRAVAGSVTPWLLVLATTLAGVLAATALGAGLALDQIRGEQALRIMVVTPFVVIPALLLVRRAVRRFGGVTGDVYGAAVEITFTATLLMPSLALSF